jgi:hypothetical protein
LTFWTLPGWGTFFLTFADSEVACVPELPRFFTFGLSVGGMNLWRMVDDDVLLVTLEAVWVSLISGLDIVTFADSVDWEWEVAMMSWREG